MARSKAASRLPEEQLREKEKDGRIRRFICDILTLRVLAYVCAQPASFSFILSFMLITLTMPPMALYIKHASKLPDLDAMRSWNAYLGKLPELGLCVSDDNYTFTAPTGAEPVASAFVDFCVDNDMLTQYNGSLLVANLTGSQLHTKIKNSTNHKRIDDDVHVTIFILLTELEAEYDNSSCRRGCIDISAPKTATPARHPQIPNTDFTFNTRVLNSYNKPDSPSHGVVDISCHGYYSSTGSRAVNLTLGGRCKDVRPRKEEYRKHGLITIYLSESQKQESCTRILLGTFGVAAIGLAFAVGIGCTERPPKPKNRPE